MTSPSARPPYEAYREAVERQYGKPLSGACPEHNPWPQRDGTTWCANCPDQHPHPPCPSCGTKREDISKRAGREALWCGECGVIEWRETATSAASSEVRDA